jgi:hypothetical protein
MNDKKLAKWLLLLLLLPLGLALFSEERFRYPCQDPANWDKDFCQRPLCDVTRTCPDHIFKGQRDPKLGPTNEPNKTTNTPVSGMGTQGVNCGK